MIATKFFKDIRVPILAGMEFSHGKTINNKMRVVGYDVFRIRYDTSSMDCVVGETRIKRVFNRVNSFNQIN